MALLGILLSPLVTARHGLVQTSHLLLQAGIVSSRHDCLLSLAKQAMASPARSRCDAPRKLAAGAVADVSSTA